MSDNQYPTEADLAVLEKLGLSQTPVKSTKKDEE